MSDAVQEPEAVGASGTTPDNPKAQGRPGIENLRSPSSTDEAREWGRRGGIASGIARRKRITLRDELSALLEAKDGVVAKSIVIAMCTEAKRGNVGAFRAIAQVLGELKEVVEMPDLPPPFVIEVHDPAYVEAERKRQEAMMAKNMEAMTIDVTPSVTKDAPEFSAPEIEVETDTWTQYREDGESANAARRPRTGAGAAVDAPKPEKAREPAPKADAPQAAQDAPAAKPPQSQHEAQPPTPPHPKPKQEPPRVPRTPSEAAAMRREREAREGNNAPQSAPHAQHSRPSAVPVAFPRR
jgi:hypothetical protein